VDSAGDTREDARMSGIPFASAVRGGRGIALFTGLLLASCRTPSEPRPPEARYEHMRPEFRELEAAPSREWLCTSFGWLARDNDVEDPVGDGLVFAIQGGFDLSITRFTPSIELGIAYTSAHVDVPDTSDVELWRGTAGMRGTWYAEGWRPHVRGGGFVRDSSDDLDEPFDPYATGFYLGAGIDWPYEGMWLGPSLTYYRAIDEDAPGGDGEEWIFALSATFRL